MAENEPTASGDGTGAVPWYLQNGGTPAPAGSVSPPVVSPASPPVGPSAPPSRPVESPVAADAPAGERVGTGRHASDGAAPAAGAAASGAAPPRHAASAPSAPAPSSEGFPVLPESPSTPPAKPSAKGGPRLPLGPVAWGVGGALVLVAAVVAAILLGGSSEDGTTTAGGGAERSAAEELGGRNPTPALPSVGAGTAAGPSAVPSTSAPQLTGDLNLGVPISSPACDSTWVVFLGAAIDPATYQADVSALLAGRSDAKYLRTLGGCSSMRQQTPEGAQIYAVYVGPYPDQAAACAARSAIGGNAYVKRMDNVTPPEQLWTC